MRRLRIASLFLSLAVYPPIHELGHLTAAILKEIQILGIEYSVITVRDSFTSTGQILLFKTSGFLVTFYPALILFLYLWKRGSHWAHPAYVWLMASPLVSSRDFLEIGHIIGINGMGQTLYYTSILSTTLMLCVYMHEVYRNKGLLASFLNIQD
ncbi:hypothetical protein MCGE09_00554 [Thaumarchaeota archaeon SCGC AB-539-E09]|nr:hypothetical protein MCGE09_00554 [Thaumarchaeota archaeon SCGC AB-539-E09]